MSLFFPFWKAFHHSVQQRDSLSLELFASFSHVLDLSLHCSIDAFYLKSSVAAFEFLFLVFVSFEVKLIT